MNTILRTQDFTDWLGQLRDAKAKARIATRLDSATLGNFGDWKPVGEGLCEMRIDVGPGYRVYYFRLELLVYVVLAGGDKRTQNKDIKRAGDLMRKIQQEKRHGKDKDENGKG